jgi:hypothetical protein
VFWGIVCIAIAIEAWKTYLAQQRVTNLTGMARAAE